MFEWKAVRGMQVAADRMEKRKLAAEEAKKPKPKLMVEEDTIDMFS